MSWFLRKAFKFGPIRLNLSKSGLGASFGVKGARLSVGPRGTHIFAGRGGVYFRERIGGGAQSNSQGGQASEPVFSSDGRHEIRTADAAELVDPSASNLLNELKRRHGLVSIAKLVGTVGCLATSAAVLLGLGGSLAAWTVAIGLGITTLVGVIIGRKKDIERKTVNISFDLDDESRRRFEDLQGALSALARCSRVWRLTSEESTDDWKRHGGANSLVTRNQVTLARGLPAVVKSNITPHVISTLTQTLYFFPDRLLVFQRRRVGGVPYADLQVEVKQVRFQEEGSVPGDSKVVDTTWRYVNKNGSPDRRFNDNREIPICEYGELRLSSPTGLRFVFQTSKAHVPEIVRTAFERVRDLKPAQESQRDRIVNQQTHVELTCPSCCKRYRVLVQHAGKSVKCQGCGKLLVVPGAAPAGS